MGEANFNSESIVTITEDEFTLLIISSIRTLKRNKKNVVHLSLWNSSDVFAETLNSLIENESVIVNTFRNRECI